MDNQHQNITGGITVFGIILILKKNPIDGGVTLKNGLYFKQEQVIHSEKSK